MAEYSKLEDKSGKSMHNYDMKTENRRPFYYNIKKEQKVLTSPSTTSTPLRSPSTSSLSSASPAAALAA
jgi:hypothetical protein